MSSHHRRKCTWWAWTKPRTGWRIRRDDAGFYAVALDDNMQITWRSLSTDKESKASQWLESRRCHGEPHYLTCRDCRKGGQHD